MDTTIPEDDQSNGGATQDAPVDEQRAPAMAKKEEALRASDDKDSAKFACTGAYSNVGFSEESGDGSGVVAIMQGGGAPKFIYWEGGPSPANAAVTSVSAQTMKVALSFPDFPDQKSNAILECRGSRLLFRSSDLGHNDELQLITERELAELR
ncbi:hypothetical protein [Altererythrobacter sp. TH136]|uniref:hypothetical protein n=1 Tax=Altererythrobacter sp. TH136 TaxID=2067415 RepID=UPI0011620666|nr:hypothetical protein [Altererythrobacter sp. TH136]QDM41461.1 hypothetical protein C0V74_10725 [Altererythrobacter sp. TH136]